MTYEQFSIRRFGSRGRLLDYLTHRKGKQIHADEIIKYVYEGEGKPANCLNKNKLEVIFCPCYPGLYGCRLNALVQLMKGLQSAIVNDKLPFSIKRSKVGKDVSYGLYEAEADTTKPAATKGEILSNGTKAVKAFVKTTENYHSATANDVRRRQPSILSESKPSNNRQNASEESRKKPGKIHNKTD